jgi:hypothetical protein
MESVQLYGLINSEHLIEMILKLYASRELRKEAWKQNKETQVRHKGYGYALYT